MQYLLRSNYGTCLDAYYTTIYLLLYSALWLMEKVAIDSMSCASSSSLWHLMFYTSLHCTKKPDASTALYHLGLWESILGCWPNAETAKLIQFILLLSKMNFIINWTEDERDLTKGRNTTGNMENRRILRTLAFLVRAGNWHRSNHL